MKALHSVGVDVGVNITAETPQRSHLETAALGFLGLAKKSGSFREWLKRRLFDRELILLGATEFPEAALEYEHGEWVPSIHPAIAERKLTWLFDEIDCAPEPQRQGVVKILNLACGHTMPRAAAWGIVFVETLGVFVSGHPFRSPRVDYSQAVILGPGWNLLKPHDLTKRVNKASLTALTKCIEAASLDLKRLEPEVASWLWKGSGVRLYSAQSNQDFEDVLAHVRKSGLSFASVSEGKVDVLALQPCITGSYDTLLAGLAQLE
ncbi:MAG: hypothetical protein HYT13_01975 [Candidatus Liptonbacteria bacterium]|nr:hypothetical protein [Candidatus Liptonbacteria bacterium]